MGLRDLVGKLLGDSVGLAQDEQVVFFPTFGRPDGTGGWEVRVRGWVFEAEEDSLARRALLGFVSAGLGLTPEQFDTELFRRRAGAFLVDNERAKRIAVRLGRAEHIVGPSAADGHLGADLPLHADHAQELLSGGDQGWIPFGTPASDSDDRHFAGQALLMGETGLSVISDIDDTVKVTEVGDRRVVLANTFLREFRAVPGMANVYQQWAALGATFHYVSGSPWQLFLPLHEFLMGAHFPPGTFHLKKFRIKEPDSIKRLGQHEETKREAILALLQAFPRRRFVLVGDSGEQDPGIYARLAAEFPEQVVAIFIRDVNGKAPTPSELGMTAERYCVFSDPEEIKNRELA